MCMSLLSEKRASDRSAAVDPQYVMIDAPNGMASNLKSLMVGRKTNNLLSLVFSLFSYICVLQSS